MEIFLLPFPCVIEDILEKLAIWNSIDLTGKNLFHFIKHNFPLKNKTVFSVLSSEEYHSNDNWLLDCEYLSQLSSSLFFPLDFA